MVICIQCGAKQESTTAVLEYSPGNIKLLRCIRCGEVVDKYIEYEGLLILIDMALLKVEAHRHVLSNRKFPYKLFPFHIFLELTLRLAHIEHRSEDFQQMVQNPIEFAWLVSSVSMSGVVSMFVVYVATYIFVGSISSCQMACKTVALESSVKSIFLVMGVWTYPVSFLFILRILSVACTSVGLKASIPSFSVFQTLIIGIVVGSIQGYGSSLGDFFSIAVV